METAVVGIATGPCERLLVGFTWIDDRRIECPAVVGTDSAGLRARVRPGHHVTHLRPPTWRCWRHSAGQRAPPDPQDSIRTTKAGTRVGPQRYPDLMAEDQVLERKVPARANRSPEGMKSQPKQLEHPPGWHPPSTRIASSRPSTLLAHCCHLLGGLTMSDCQSGCQSARWLGGRGSGANGQTRIGKLGGVREMTRCRIWSLVPGLASGRAAPWIAIALGLILAAALRGPAAHSPIFDGLPLPQPPYRYCSPPANLGSSNQPPLTGQGSLPLENGQLGGGTVRTADGQLTVSIGRDGLKASPVAASVTVWLDPVCDLVAPPPGGDHPGQRLSHRGS